MCQCTPGIKSPFCGKPGCEWPQQPPLTEEEAGIEQARAKAHELSTEAERAWYSYAALLDVGPDRTRAFDVYENLRNARRV
jgi:hypothetical protein